MCVYVGVVYVDLNSVRASSVYACLYELLLSVFFQVNENFAIDLIAEQPVSEVGSRVISCDGAGGALGHPKVYINLVTCHPSPDPRPSVLSSPRWLHPRPLGLAHRPHDRG